ncbi:MAG: DUF6240 domain-containing protein [Pseudobutyrivibrio sp.]|nr:DUF6240 domain-containing protein [Pseudobutyrivibrio sp.]
MQIDALKVTDYIKTEGQSPAVIGLGSGDIKDDKEANSKDTLRALQINGSAYDKKGLMTDEDFKQDLNEASVLGMSTVDQVKNVERAFDEEATAKLEKDGYDPRDLDAKTLVTVVDEIKMSLAKGGADLSKMGGLDQDEIVEMTGSVAQAMEMTKGIADNLSEDVAAYLVKNELEPTIDNIYMASYKAPNQPVEFDEEKLIETLTSLGEELDNLIAQIEESPKAESFTAADLKNAATSLLKKDLPITKDSLEYMAQLEEFTKPEEKDLLLAIEDIEKEGKDPKDAYLIKGYSLMDQARATFEEVMGIDPENITEVTAKRQLVEVQLSMTVEATFTMMKNGVSVNTADISDLLDKLKAQETNLLRILMENEAGDKDSHIDLFKEVMKEVNEIEAAPAAIFGRFTNVSQETLSSVYQVSVSVTQEYAKMEMTYEAVGTEVRADLGDNIQKAFRNIDDILSDLNIESTESSKKAVRILSYNQMEITAESVTNVKAASEMVGRTFKNMTGAVVAEIIKRGQNPLDMTMEELEKTTEDIKARLGSNSDSEGFAKFLWKAEHAGEISQEERDAYIGLYRLMHQVDKSDGAAIGALISQGTDVTLRNLMTAVRSSRHTGKEYTVDDDFGQLDELVVRDLSITEQVEKAFLTSRCRDAKEAMTPAKLMGLGENTYMEMSPDEFAQAMEEISDEESEEAYTKYVTEQVKDQMAEAAAVSQVMEEYNIPYSANMIQAVESLMENGGSDAIAKLYDKAAKNDEITDIEDLINLTLERFSEMCHSPQSMLEAQEALGDLAERVMKTMVEMEDVKTIDMEGMNLIIQQTRAMNEMANTGETYHIPIMVNNEAASMNLRIVRGVGESGLIKMAIQMESIGTMETTFRYEKDMVEASVECSTASTREMFAENAPRIASIMQEETGFAYSFSFSQRSKISASDIYNWQLGNFEEAESRDNEIQTEALYKIARGYINVIGQMFANV